MGTDVFPAPSQLRRLKNSSRWLCLLLHPQPMVTHPSHWDEPDHCVAGSHLQLRSQTTGPSRAAGTHHVGHEGFLQLPPNLQPVGEAVAASQGSCREKREKRLLPPPTEAKAGREGDLGTTLGAEDEPASSQSRFQRDFFLVSCLEITTEPDSQRRGIKSSMGCFGGGPISVVSEATVNTNRLVINHGL